MLNLTKIGRLKRKARKYYLMCHSALDGLSCGKKLGEHLSSTMSNAKVKFNKTMDELSKIDETCPKTRL